jgi:hypothetical protein
MPEGSNEKDTFGNGIRVVASYQVALFDQDKKANMQRKVQLRTDSPAQYFYQFDTELEGVRFPLDSKVLKEAGIVDHVKLVTVPLG